MRFVLLLLCLLAAGTFAAAPAFAQDAAEIAFWTSVRDSQNPAELQAYLDAYPAGAYAALAKIRIGTLGGSVATTPAPEPAPAPQPTTTATTAKSGPQVVPDMAVYPPFEEITINWSGIPTSLTSGWIALFRQGEAAELTRASIDFREKTGSTAFAGQLPGTYEVRLLTPPYGSEYVLAKASFSVAEPGAAEAGAGAALTPASATVMPFEPIEVRWEGIPSSMDSGWIRMMRADGTEMTRLSLSTHTDKAGGSTFDGTLPGDYTFELLSPPYGSELVLATAKVTVIDPSAAQPAPEPAPQPADTTGAAPADATGQTAEATADTQAAGRTGTREAAIGTLVAKSTLGNVSFPQPPKAGDQAIGPTLIGLLGASVPIACTGTAETYMWDVDPTNDAELQGLLNETAVAFKGNGYDLAEVPHDVQDMLIYRATGPDKVVMIFKLEQEEKLLFLILCGEQ